MSGHGDDPPPYEGEKLYQQVWEKPIHELAKRYRCSDVYLSCICRKMSVPLPSRGLWAKQRSAAPRPPLPKLTPEEARRLHFIGDRRSTEQRRYQQAAEDAKGEAPRSSSMRS